MNLTRLTPLLKYPGGKAKEISYLTDYFPKTIDNYIEPFVGGGAVYWSIEANNYIINDLSTELIELYRCVESQNPIFFDYIMQIDSCWANKEMYTELIEVALNNYIYHETQNEIIFSELANNLLVKFPMYNKSDVEFLTSNLKVCFKRKSNKLKKISEEQEINNIKQNAHAILGDALYGLNRRIYNITLFKNNKELKTSLYLFLREFSYSSMFRFNAKGEFNVPFGGNSYVSKTLDNKISYYRTENVHNKLKKTKIHNLDYKDVLDTKLTNNDFVFLDPPYDSEFSEYDNNVFDKEHHKKLASILSNLECKWLLVIKNTDFIYELYNNENNYIDSFNKNYSVNFNNRNDKKVTHLIITNYKI